MLASAGVEVCFGLPGVHNLAYWEAQAPGRPRILGVRHEQACGYAADGLARATGGLGVALTTSGPGAANAVAAFGEAAASGSPIVLIASEAPLRLRREDGVSRGLLHEMDDQSALFAPLAKAVLSAATPDEAVAAVTRAAELAMAAPRGPVYVGIPADLLGQPAERRPPGARAAAPGAGRRRHRRGRAADRRSPSGRCCGSAAARSPPAPPSRSTRWPGGSVRRSSRRTQRAGCSATGTCCWPTRPRTSRRSPT